ncbi:kinetochore protein NDC80 homolog [Impatiens glandulifera]|uniref:kinetochore protein NDC80 homolog n=1 Tax=Impatiens glandulifera TaxID=253017 RepID=UPI001FB0F330|nr:kinetochore protein NDC80 homolog [Impatiens glandulifera]XP_047341938.1 kinetochore protein NDC80 homolog [Impatiens glandulifera]
MRNTSRRPPNESFADDRKPPPTPMSSGDPWLYPGVGGRRDSDASFCSNRSAASSVPITDRGNQISAIRTINSFLASHSCPIIIKPSLPSGKEVIETLKFILNCLEFPLKKLEDDLFTVLKFLNCPIKINKSALKSPGTPHVWPSLLAVIHWLVQLCMYDDCSTEPTQVISMFEDNKMLTNLTESYKHFLQGDDEAAEMVDREFIDKLVLDKDAVQEGVNLAEENVKSLEAKLESLRSEPSLIELREREMRSLEEDYGKFQVIVDQYNGHKVSLEKSCEDKEKKLETKVMETVKVCEENEELRKKIEIQGINARDAERMKKELQAVERDIAEEETARNSWEEKAWELDSSISQKLKELETLLMDGNQALKRIKLGNTFQYELNSRGSTAADVLGIDYKSTLKPALDSLANDIKNNSMTKLEERISLQQQSVDIAAKIEAKKIRLLSLQSCLDEVEEQINWLKKDSQDYISRCASQAQMMVENVESDAHKLEALEKEVEMFLNNSKLELQKTVSEDEEETQMCARELFAVVDSVSKYKENVASKINEMETKLSETVNAISDMHRSSYYAQFDNI